MAKGSGKDVTNRFKEEIMGSLKEAVLSEIRDVAKAAEGESSKTQSQVEDSFEAVGKAAGKGLEKAAKQVERDSAKLEKAISSSFNKINKIKYKEVGKSSGDTLSFLDKFDTSKGLKKVTKKLQQQENEFREAISGHVNKINGIVSEVWNVDKSEIKFSDISSSLYDKKSALKSANEYISELESSGKKVNNAMSTQIARREALFEALNKNRENRKSYSSLVGVERNEKIAASMLEELKIVKLIHKYTSEIGDKSSYKKALEVDDFGKLRSSISGSLDSMFTDNKALTESFGEMYKSLSMLIDGYHAGLKALQGDDKKAAESILEGLVESTRKTTKKVKDETKDFAKEISEEVKKANNYIDSAKTNAISLSTKKTSKHSTKATFDKPPKNISTGAATEKEYQYVGEVANLLRNTGDRFDAHPGVQYFNALIEKKPELKALADEIKNFKVVTEDVKNAVSGDSSSDLPITDSNKIKVATEEQNRYADALERCKKLGIDISNFTGEVSDPSKIKESTDALEEMIAQAERAGKSGVNTSGIDNIKEYIRKSEEIFGAKKATNIDELYDMYKNMRIYQRTIEEHPGTEAAKDARMFQEEIVALNPQLEKLLNNWERLTKSKFKEAFGGFFDDSAPLSKDKDSSKVRTLEQTNEDLENQYNIEKAHLEELLKLDKENDAAIERLKKKQNSRMYYAEEVYGDKYFGVYDKQKLEKAQEFFGNGLSVGGYYDLPALKGTRVTQGSYNESVAIIKKMLTESFMGEYGLFQGLVPDIDEYINSYLGNYKDGIKGFKSKDIQDSFNDILFDMSRRVRHGVVDPKKGYGVVDNVIESLEVEAKNLYATQTRLAEEIDHQKYVVDQAREAYDPIFPKKEQKSIRTQDSSTISVSENTSEIEENTQAHDRNNDSLAEKLQYLKDIQNHSKFMDDAEDRRISMEEKGWDAGGNNPKSEADSLSKIKKYEDHCEAIEKANNALGEFQEKYESVIVTMKDGSEIKITDLYDLDELKLLKSKIADIKFNPFEDEDVGLYDDFDKIEDEVNSLAEYRIKKEKEVQSAVEETLKTQQEEIEKLHKSLSYKRTTNVDKQKFDSLLEGVDFSDKSSIKNRLDDIQSDYDNYVKTLSSVNNEIDNYFLKDFNLNDVFNEIKSNYSAGKFSLAAKQFESYKERGGKKSAESISEEFATNLENYLVQANQEIIDLYNKKISHVKENHYINEAKNQLQERFNEFDTKDRIERKKYESSEKVYDELYAYRNKIKEQNKSFDSTELLSKSNSLLDEYIKKSEKYSQLMAKQKKLATSPSPEVFEIRKETNDLYVELDALRIKLFETFSEYKSSGGVEIITSDLWSLKDILHKISHDNDYIDSAEYIFDILKGNGSHNVTKDAMLKVFEDKKKDSIPTLSLNEESSDQLAFPIEGVKEASFTIQNAQEEIQAEVKETNDIIEGQIGLFEYLDSVNAQSSKVVDNLSSTQQATEEVKELTQAEIEAASKAKDLAKQIASFYGIKTDSKAFQSLETEMKDFIDVLSVDPDTLNPISGIVQSMLGSTHSLRKILGEDIADEYANMIKEISGNIRIENDMEQSVFGNDNLTFDAVKRMLSKAKFSKDGNVSISELLPGFNAKFGTNIEDDGNESNILSRIVEQIQASKESVLTNAYDKMRQDGFFDVTNDILNSFKQVETARSAEESANRTSNAQDKHSVGFNDFGVGFNKSGETSDSIDDANFKVLKQIGTLDEGAVVTYKTAEGQIGSAIQRLDEYGNIITEKVSPLITNFETLKKKFKSTFSEIIKYQSQLQENQAKYGDSYDSTAIEKVIADKQLDLQLLLAQADIFADDKRYAIEYKQFIDEYSAIKDEILDKQAVKDAVIDAKNIKEQEKQLNKLEQLRSKYQKKLSSVNSSFGNLTEYKEAQDAIDNLSNINDVSDVETSLNKLEKVINDFKQNVKSTASLDPVFAAIKKQGNLDNIVEKYRLEFEKLGYSTEEATNEVKKFQELATKINGIDITSKTGMKDFGVELNKFNSEEDHLKNILDITKKRQILQDKINREDNKSYKEKFQVIKDYSDAKDKYNTLLAREAKQGSSFELIEELGNQEAKVKTLRREAIEASKAITNMFRSGAITKDQKISAQSLLKDVNLEKTDSFNVLSGVLMDQSSAHSDEITKVTEEYKKLGLTTDEIKEKLKSLKIAESDVIALDFTGSIDKRIDAERTYKEELGLVEADINKMKIAKQDKARQDKIDRENAKANEDAYKRQIDAINDYSEAQDKLNNLLGQEVKQGKSDELTAKIKSQQDEVDKLHSKAREATAELVRMSKAGNISVSQRDNGLNFLKDIESGGTASFKVLAGIKADKAKKDQYAGQTKAYEQLISQMLFGKSIDGVLFKSASVGETGKTTLTFLESVGEKAREVKYVIDDANDALDEMVNGTFALDPETSSTGKWRKKNDNDVLTIDGSETYNSFLKLKEAYNYLISSEDKYQKLLAKSESGMLTKSQEAEFNVLIKARQRYNEVIEETKKLKDQEKKDKFGVEGSKIIDGLSEKYVKKQDEAKETHDAYIDAYSIKDPVELEKIKAAIEHTKQLLKEIETSGVSGYDKVFSSANIGIEQLNARLKTGTISVEDYNAEINKICDSLKDTVAVVNKYASDGGMSEMTKYIEGIGGNVVGFNNETKQLTYTIKDHTGAIKTMCIEYEETSGVIKKVNDISKNTESSFNKVTSALKSKLSPLAQYAKNFIDVGSSIQALKKGISVIRDLDVSLTEMRKVSDESLESLKNFQDVSFDIAGSIGTTAKQIQESSADYMRLGFNLNTATELAEDANVYANVGDMDIATATEHMVSSIQAWKSEFGNEIEASEEIVDRYNQIGNNFAITSADIGAAMERSAAALKAGGNTLNESLGLITAGNIIQQDAETTANALKILSLRIRGAKTDLESMGEETDGLASSTSKMRDEIKALSGVDIMLDEETFKSTAQIIQELGAVYGSLSDIQRAGLLEKIAGKNRASTISGLLENYEVIGEVIKSAEESDGSAARENQRYLDSIEGKYSQLKNEVQEFWYELISSETIKTFLDFGIKVVDILGDVIDRMGELGSIMAVLFAHSAANNFLDRILGGEKKPGLLSNILGLFGMKSGKNSGGRVKMFTLIIKYATESFSREVCEFWCTLE